MNMWPGLWPGLAWPQAITASGRFRGLGFLTRGLALAWPQAAASGRLRPWPRQGVVIEWVVKRGFFSGDRMPPWVNRVLYLWLRQNSGS